MHTLFLVAYSATCYENWGGGHTSNREVLLHIPVIAEDRVEAERIAAEGIVKLNEDHTRTCPTPVYTPKEHLGTREISLIQPMFLGLTELRNSDLPKNKAFLPTDVQCDNCGGYGCDQCEDKGWLPAGHPGGRKCEREGCGNPIKPDNHALYCTNQCAAMDA